MKWRSVFREIAAGEALLFLAGLLQGTSLLTIAGVKPNVTLVILLVLAFVTSNFPIYFFFVLGGIIFIRFSPLFDPSLLAIAAIAFCAFLLKKWLPWHQSINSIVFSASGTVIFYLLGDAAFIGREPFTILGEAAYNTVIAAAAFPAVRWLLGDNMSS